MLWVPAFILVCLIFSTETDLITSLPMTTFRKRMTPSETNSLTSSLVSLSGSSCSDMRRVVTPIDFILLRRWYIVCFLSCSGSMATFSCRSTDSSMSLTFSGSSIMLVYTDTTDRLSMTRRLAPFASTSSLR